MRSLLKAGEPGAIRNRLSDADIGLPKGALPKAMSEFRLSSFKDGTELAAAVARRCFDLIPVGPVARPFCLALSGGRIAKSFFAALASEALRRGSKLQPVHFFWADERCVSSKDPESNFALAEQLLFDPVGIDPEQIHRIRGELPPDTAARDAAVDLTRFAPADAQGQPALDLVLLGMGEDGHVASLFPGELVQPMSSLAVYRAVVAPKPPPNRITLGYPAIVAAREVWVLASGPGKESALAESLRADSQTPLARVLRMRRKTEIFTDIHISKSAG